MKLSLRFSKQNIPQTLLVVVLALSLASLTSARNAVSHAKLQVSEAPEATKYWKILGVDLVQEFDATTGVLKLENTSDQILDNVALYAEYYDAGDRRTFSLVFSQTTNLGDDQTPIAPGMSRTLYSAAMGMVPASKPTQVRIYLIRQTTLNQKPAPNDIVSLKSPVILGGSLNSDFTSLQLPENLIFVKGPVLDLVLARVSINERGTLTQVKILGSTTPEIESWFSTFVRALHFYPATINSVPVPSDALISVQAVLSKDVTPELYVVSPWVRTYIASSAHTEEVPPVNRIVFASPSDKIQISPNSEYIARPSAQPGKLEISSLGSEWSVTAYKWIRDESMPQYRARQLAGKQSPE